MGEIKAVTINSIESKLNRKISYSSISPSVFMFLEFRNLKILDNEEELIKIDKIRVYYNLPSILKGDLVNALKEIRIVKSNFNFNYDKDKELLELFNNSINKDTSTPGFPDIKISGKNLNIALTINSDKIVLRKIFFNLNHNNKIFEYTIKGSISSQINSFKSGSGKTNFRITGNVSDNIKDLSSKIVLKNIENNYFFVNKLSLLASFDKGIFTIRKIEDDRPFDININYDSSNKNVLINLVSDNFIPIEHFKPKQIDSKIVDWLNSSVTGNVQLVYSLDTNEFSYKGEIKSIIRNKKYHLPISLFSLFSGNNRAINFEKLLVRSNENSLNYNGIVKYENLEPRGYLNINYNVDNKKILANIFVTKKLNKLHIRGESIQVDNINIYDFETDLDLFDKDVDFVTSFTIINPVHDHKSDSGTISMDGNFQFIPDYFLTLSLDTENIAINPFITLLEDKLKQKLKLVPILNLNSNMIISTDFEKFSFSAMEVELRSGNNRIGFETFGNNKSIEIDNIEILWNNKTVESSIKLNMNKNSISIKSDSIFQDIPYTFKADYYPEIGFFFDGNHNLSGSFIKKDNYSDFQIKFQNFPVPLKNRTTEISLNASGLLFSDKNWEMTLKELEIKNIPGLISDNKLSAEGSVSNNQINITTINYSDPISILTGYGLFTYDLKNNQKLSGDFLLETESTEKYSGSLEINDKNISLNTSFIDFPINRIKDFPATGLLNGDINIEGILPSPDITLGVQLKKGIYHGSPLEIETSLFYNDSIINLNYFRISYKNQTFQKGIGTFKLKTGEFEGNTELHGLFNNKTIKSLIKFSGNTIPLNETLDISQILKNNFNLNFFLENIIVDKKTVDPWSFSIFRQENSISFNGGPENSLSGSFTDTGQFNLEAGQGLPVTGMANGFIDHENINIKIRELDLDLKLLNIIPTGGYFLFHEGRGKGRLDITGPLDNPSFDGIIVASNVQSSVSLLANKIEPFNTEVVFKDHNITIGPETVTTDKGSAVIAVDLLIENWIPGNYSVEIKVPYDQKIHIIYNVPTIGLGLDGMVSGRLLLSGNKGNLFINSDLVASNCIVGIGQKGENQINNKMALNLDMKFTMDKDVKFIWPSKTLPILQATSKTNQVIKVNVDSLSDTFSVIGDINIKHGSINYFQKIFYLTKGSIIFNESELKFDPILDFTAKIKEIDSKGEVVNISLILENTPLSKFEPRFESDPPMTDLEIFSILGTGIFTEIGTERVDLTSALLLTSDLVTQFGIIQSFEKKVKNIFNLDLFSIRTQMIQNILIDRFIADSSEIYSDRLDSFGSYLNNTTLYLGKYFGNDIFLQALLQISNEQLSSAGQLSSGDELKIESTISLEWQTPFFLLGFSIKPDFVDPLSSIQNTSLKLSWDYSY